MSRRKRSLSPLPPELGALGALAGGELELPAGVLPPKLPGLLALLKVLGDGVPDELPLIREA